jgi:dTDP-4-dehydrorhamnose 3,5-epimerase
MECVETDLPGVKLITPKKFGDHRGFFSEVYKRGVLSGCGVGMEFVQDNHSLSAEKGVVRVLHYQLPPKAQDKLIRVIRGAILDVAVDIRRGSPTFGKWTAMELSALNWRQLFVPIGFAHGFVTLEPNTEVIYKVSDYYSPEHERGVAWDDPDLSVAWGIEASAAILSDRDRKHARLRDVAAVHLF